MGHFSELGRGLSGPVRNCQEPEETKAKVRNVPRASGPAACTVPREGSVGREKSGCWSLRFGQVRRESSWAGRVGGTASSSRNPRWKVPVTPCRLAQTRCSQGTGLLDPLQPFRGHARSRTLFTAGVSQPCTIDIAKYPWGESPLLPTHAPLRTTGLQKYFSLGLSMFQEFPWGPGRGVGCSR